MNTLISHRQTIIILLLISLNLLSFLLCSYDKYISRLHKGNLRIRERDFFILGLAGGAIGILLAMLLWRHKTRHTQFMIFFPLVSIVQAAFLTFWLAGILS